MLQELTNGSAISDWSAPEVRESLDLCLSCKACASDCPAGVDMARYKSEVLYRTYRGKRRPASHYTLGRLPSWLAAIGRTGRVGPAVLNRVLAVDRLVNPCSAPAGSIRRPVPRLAPETFRRHWRRRRATARPASTGDPVVLWADTFTDALNPATASAAATVLTHAGYRVVVPDGRACCGLTWITTGQLDGAKKRLRRLLDVLGPYAAQGIPIVGLEPSCTAVLRSDLLDLLPDDPTRHDVAAATRTLAEVLASRDGTEAAWRPPDLARVQLIVQPHCHHHSVMGFATDRRLLETAGAQMTVLAGCCGLAGNFGMEKGHYEMSVAVAETSLLPALRDRPPDAIVLADGFSCRTQIDHLAGVPSRTLAQLLAEHLQTPS